MIIFAHRYFSGCLISTVLLEVCQIVKKGKKVDGGYIVNGSLPWVSNLGDDHMFGTMFAVEGQPGLGQAGGQRRG